MFADLLSNISCGSARYSANLQSTTDLEGRWPASLAWWYPYFRPTTSPLQFSPLLLHIYLTRPSSLSPSFISSALRYCLSGSILAHCRCPAITGHLLRNSAFCDKPFAPTTKPLQINHHDLLHRLFQEHQVEELPWIRLICNLYDHRS